MKILITGAAGFIGFHLVRNLCSKSCQVVGLDNINDYYDVNLKYARLNELGIERSGAEKFSVETVSSLHENFKFLRLNLEDANEISSLFEREKFDVVVNLAAQAGVRYSIENPKSYVQSNVVGFLNILEGCRHTKVKHLLYASSSSVYGENKKVPFATSDNVDYPISLYAATKKSNELMAHTYSHLYNIPTTGLRFFTVYGPWGRPDMALFLFTKAITEGKAINVFNNGKMSRDFTYIDDIIHGINIVLENPPKDYRETKVPYKVSNIGNGSPETLEHFISAIENNIGIKAVKNMMPMQAGDVPQTWADIDDLKALGYNSNYDVNTGVKNFVEWYKNFYNK
ncbi:NAD-dependent epimerase/dehydratase family protein [Algibacter amylolyticus]|uniref:NAD-dependent epimerase/dehydratase family protein n=1 Tax=Algibacter amylolyticus TaxID=1608400 RepID=A0A5M7BIS1_9FLAO|nr:NAD-dependent epimerase/dehydratase family protein [Algibacter amylolyticus]KAA5827421.1 NAD-dependent epimerase/dehydratase family protein [Algibacter amylolyticus]MBB5266613.1 UDP-glucuronate 4-epimerase [Algibacter amylolyticus]TSJ81666.1 NAD-dependent epimerase/dehydratase family protein [Algibacter amylolyticus]